MREFPARGGPIYRGMFGFINAQLCAHFALAPPTPEFGLHNQTGNFNLKRIRLFLQINKLFNGILCQAFHISTTPGLVL